MKTGDTYPIPPEPPDDYEATGVDGEPLWPHGGHTVTVLLVVPTPPSHDHPGGPDLVNVECSCGATWSFEDIDESGARDVTG